MTNFLFVLRSDDNEKVTRCFQFAKIAHEKGYDVNIFLIDDGVWWSQTSRDASQRTITGDCPGDYLPYLIEHKVPVGVCTPCAKNRQLDAATFHPNAKLDGGPHLIDLAADARVFNF
jgi:tRNA 2-thiouridine synthesizing protein D